MTIQEWLENLSALPNWAVLLGGFGLFVLGLTVAYLHVSIIMDDEKAKKFVMRRNAPRWIGIVMGFTFGLPGVAALILLILHVWTTLSVHVGYVPPIIWVPLVVGSVLSFVAVLIWRSRADDDDEDKEEESRTAARQPQPAGPPRGGRFAGLSAAPNLRNNVSLLDSEEE